MDVSFNPDLGWVEGKMTIDGSSVDVVFLPDSSSNITSATKALKYFESLAMPEVVEDAKRYAIQSMASDATEEKELANIRLEGITVYRNNEIEFYFSDNGVFGGHTIVVFRKQDAFILCTLEG